jgi:hypothetical protein
MALNLQATTWEMADAQAREFFCEHANKDVQSGTDALRNIDVLTASIVVACSLAATREHGERGVTMRDSAAPQRLKRRPPPALQAARKLDAEARTLRYKAKYAKGDERRLLYQQAKAAEKAARNFALEAEETNARHRRQEAQTRFTRNAWAAAYAHETEWKNVSRTLPRHGCQT